MPDNFPVYTVKAAEVLDRVFGFMRDDLRLAAKFLSLLLDTPVELTTVESKLKPGEAVPTIGYRFKIKVTSQDAHDKLMSKYFNSMSAAMPPLVKQEHNQADCPQCQQLQYCPHREGVAKEEHDARLNRT